MSKREVVERFEKFVHTEPNSGCHLWGGAIGAGGYGHFMLNSPYPHKLHRAHRVAWILSDRKIPKGRWLLHHCDNRACVNIDHLYLGNVNDNSADMAKRKRGRIGSDLPYGVTRNKDKYEASMKFRGSRIYVGLFRTIEKASDAVNAQWKKIYGIERNREAK